MRAMRPTGTDSFLQHKIKWQPVIYTPTRFPASRMDPSGLHQHIVSGASPEPNHVLLP